MRISRVTKEDVTTRESYSELSLGGTLMVCMRREVPHSRRSSSGRGRGLPPRHGDRAEELLEEGSQRGLRVSAMLLSSQMESVLVCKGCLNEVP